MMRLLVGILSLLFVSSCQPRKFNADSAAQHVSNPSEATFRVDTMSVSTSTYSFSGKINDKNAFKEKVGSFFEEYNTKKGVIQGKPALGIFSSYAEVGQEKYKIKIKNISMTMSSYLDKVLDDCSVKMTIDVIDVTSGNLAARVSGESGPTSSGNRPSYRADQCQQASVQKQLFFEAFAVRALNKIPKQGMVTADGGGVAQIDTRAMLVSTFTVNEANNERAPSTNSQELTEFIDTELDPYIPPSGHAIYKKFSSVIASKKADVYRAWALRVNNVSLLYYPKASSKRCQFTVNISFLADSSETQVSEAEAESVRFDAKNNSCIGDENMARQKLYEATSAALEKLFK